MKCQDLFSMKNRMSDAKNLLAALRELNNSTMHPVLKLNCGYYYVNQPRRETMYLRTCAPSERLLLTCTFAQSEKSFRYPPEEAVYYWLSKQH